jgi:hypothetical protein
METQNTKQFTPKVSRKKWIEANFPTKKIKTCLNQK